MTKLSFMKKSITPKYLKPMKKNLTILLMLILMSSLWSIRSNAQITLQFTLDSIMIGDQFYCTDIGNNDFKYVLLNSNTNSFMLYNMDMTPYLNVPIPNTIDSIKNGFIVTYITKSLFDCDSTTIEYVYEEPYNGLHSFYIYRTDGTLLFIADSARAPYAFGPGGGSHDFRPIINTSDGAKLFLMFNNVTNLRIYSLCGYLPTNIYDFTANKQFVKIYPNPATMELNFEITPPNNQDNFQIVIFDSNAKEQKLENISIKQTKFTLNVSNISSGTYFYSLVSKYKVYQTGKFIITK
jgi:hypothetical protein